MECEICGARATRKSKIEGVLMDVCDECVQSGEEVIAPRVFVTAPNVRLPDEMNVSVRGDLGQFVKKRREKANLTQEELARRLLLNASLITRIENGWMPTLDIVDKLERFFKASLKEADNETVSKTKAEKKSVTLGDVVEIKRRR